MATHEMTAEEYRAAIGAPTHDAGSEMDAAAYRRMIGASASDLLPRRTLDSSNVNTESEAKVAFREWLLGVSPSPVVAEYQFDDRRRYRADWAIPDLKLLFEFDGVTHHTTITGAWRDAEKGNLAQIDGWLFIRVNARSLSDGSGYRDAVNAFAARGVTV